MNLSRLRDEFNKRKGAQEQTAKQLEKARKSVKQLSQKDIDLKEAQAVVQEVSRKTHEELEYCVSELVTECLQLVFDEPIEMKLRFKNERGKTNAYILLQDEEGREIPPIDADGAGTADIMSFGLRMVMYSLAKDTRPLFILDEPFKKLNDPSREMHRKAAEMVKTISSELGIQIIMVTVLPELREFADKVFEVKKVKGVSKVKEKITDE